MKLFRTSAAIVLTTLLFSGCSSSASTSNSSQAGQNRSGTANPESQASAMDKISKALGSEYPCTNGINRSSTVPTQLGLYPKLVDDLLEGASIAAFDCTIPAWPSQGEIDALPHRFGGEDEIYRQMQQEQKSNALFDKLYPADADFVNDARGICVLWSQLSTGHTPDQHPKDWQQLVNAVQKRGYGLLAYDENGNPVLDEKTGSQLPADGQIIAGMMVGGSIAQVCPSQQQASVNAASAILNDVIADGQKALNRGEK